MFMLTSCGKEDATSIVDQIKHQSDHLESYQAKGTMILHTGQKPQHYQVEVWYKNPHFYRVHLSNEGKDVTQLILKNNEGVFVITPEVKKSFRFQSNWPDNQMQVYLYQSMLQSILKDEQRVYTEEGDDLVFEVKADYHHDLLKKQRVWLNKSQLAPRRVEVIDQQQKVFIEFQVNSFVFNPSFEDRAFDREQNITSSRDSNSQNHFGIIEPSYIPQGVVKKDVSQMKIGEEDAIMIRYEGTYQFNLVEQRPTAKSVSMSEAQLIDLGYTQGVLSGEQYKTLTWMSNGVEFRIQSANLPVQEMIHIAQAIRGQTGKF
jgi:outer membrane lipoprotein-sorting protein